MALRGGSSRKERHGLGVLPTLRRLDKRALENVRFFGGFSLGAGILERIPGQVASQGAQGLQAGAGLFPSLGAAQAGGFTLRLLRQLRRR